MSIEIVLASIVLVAAFAPAAIALPHDRLAVDAALPLLAWFPLGIVGVILIDHGQVVVGRAFVAVAAVPLLIVGIAAFASSPTGLTEVGLQDGVGGLGPITVLPLFAFSCFIATRQGLPRTLRRWRFWIVVVSAGGLVAAVVAWTASEAAFGAIAVLGLGAVALVGACSASGSAPRPVDEPLVDAALLAAVVLVSLLSGLSMRWVAHREQVFGADTVGLLAAAAAAAIAVPGARSLRRRFVERRYGSGAITTRQLAEISTELSVDEDASRLLSRAASVVVASCGLADARIDLDATPPADGWYGYPLVVGLTDVGMLSVRPTHAEGLEVRQERAVAQLLPAVALVARAVSCAIDAQRARVELANERTAERARILSDLHDDLGPVLAGMSMQVAAAQAERPLPELDTIADGLRMCRSDLRRIVSGLTPPALEDGDLGRAVDQLAAAFTSSEGPAVSVVGSVPMVVGSPQRVVVYRTVAEGLTNAVRHAAAAEVTIEIVRSGDWIEAKVVDDGEGGPVVPSVGLTSLRSRAEELGGSLYASGGSSGTSLVLRVPDGSD